MSAAEPEDGWDPASPDRHIEWEPTTSIDLPSPFSPFTDLAIPEHLWGPREVAPGETPAPIPLPSPTIVAAPSGTENPPAAHRPVGPPEASVSGSSGQLDAAALDALLQPERATPAPHASRSGGLLRRLRPGRSR